jgi:hypothetical protein
MEIRSQICSEMLHSDPTAIDLYTDIFFFFFGVTNKQVGVTDSLVFNATFTVTD